MRSLTAPEARSTLRELGRRLREEVEPLLHERLPMMIALQILHLHRVGKRRKAVKSEHLTFRKGFRVSVSNDRSQAAVMVIAKGGKEGGPDNRHRGADQWLFVVSGTGAAVINGHKLPLSAGSMVLIERGETHEIRNTGRSLLQTVSVYVPPAYKPDGDELPAGKK
jgi:mannose-6-phosphate isomerase-like protein (cupin superfamily)